MSNITDVLSDLAITRSLLLQRVSNGLSQDVARVYTDIMDDISDAIKTANPITIRNSSVTIKELKSRIDPDIAFVKDDLTDLAKTEAGYIASSTNAVIGADIFAKIPTDATLSNIYKTSLIEGATISNYFSALDKSMQTDLERAIRLGASIGETNYELAKRVDGVLNKGINHSKAIARTSVATVSNQARQSVYQANDDVIKGYEHLSTLDSRTSFVCSSRDGAMWDTNGKGLNAQGRKNRYQVPPLHFNCRSTLVPVLKSWEELGIDGLDEIPRGTRSSLDGQISSGTNFEKWIGGKDATFQKKYLGAGRYELWKSGKITFSDLVNQQGRTLNMSELQGLSKSVIVPKREIFNASNISELSGEKFMLDRWSNKAVGIRRAYGTTMPNKDLVDDFNIIFEKDGDYKGVIHRGLNFSGTKSLENIYDTIRNTKVGGILESDVAPASWSKSLEQASKFTKGNNGVIFTMKKYNTYGYDIEDISKYKFEQEVLMKPNVKIRIVSKKMKDGLLYIEIEEF